ncbi:ion transporter [Agaribacterium haliotis]|uniref:ion transporter n=1 Tax=Agaribacterium haliotis TaxID=2013869 RepID=UPI000BB53521|nr:ion transporter [Agaribacterium haliotis]
MSAKPVKERLYEIIFGTDSKLGKLFDICLIVLIISSVLVLMIESLSALPGEMLRVLRAAEWLFTFIFTLEYLLRLYCAPKALRYARSFYGVIDLLSILPSYLSLFVPGANYLLIVRLLRVLRVFRILKLVRYLSEANVMLRAMLQSRRKIMVFFFSVVILAVIFGSLMYVVEGPEHGFSSIPKSVYWTIVTITTVGYGDITPQTSLGQFIASLAMLTGYSIIAVPTGILTAELTQEMQRDRQRRVCRSCERSGHEAHARHCLHCGERL